MRNGLRERFERLVACAVEVELGRKYDHQSQAADGWLDLLKREGRYGHEWKIGLLLTLSAERCKELRLRALMDQNSCAAEIFREIEGELRTLLAQNPRDELYAIDERAGETPTVDAPKPGSPDAGDSRTLTQWNVCATDRRARLDAAIDEVWKATGMRISRADIWRLARYKFRTEFERWESSWYEKRGKKGNASAHARFTKILDEKLYLNIFPAIPRISPPCALLGGEPNNPVGGAR